MKLKSKLTIFFSIILFVGCKKDDPNPEPPIITFLDAEISENNSFSIVRFEFFDNDGDLGLKQDENSGEQEFNVFVDYFEKENGTWILKTPFVDSTFNFDTNLWEIDTISELHQRFPFLENEEKQSLEGETEIILSFNRFGFSSTAGADTFKYEISIKDRAFNLSNIITTTDLIVN